MGLNFKFRYTQFQLAFTEPLFVFVDPLVDFANFANLFANPFVDFLGSQFDFNMVNFFYFWKLTTMSSFMSSIFLILFSKSLILI